ncbi:MAG TPA: septal ring lytic transglycosylase RlpA family protein [Geobacteraceae bacterium]|nr:septal ring lytic transglycosylase RlpA family protein [Geobacteraceae bacterium]
MARLNLKGILAMVLLLCQLALPFPTHPLQAEEIPPDSNGVKAAPVVAPEQEGAKGIASYYAKRYNGRKTCSGVRYNPEKLTAAHPDLPFGTRVKVINLANDREVIVTVNDRCRDRSFPFIDLSRAAAKKLGFLGKGTAKVVIMPLDEEDS